MADARPPLRDCRGRPARHDRRDQGALPQARAGLRVRSRSPRWCPTSSSSRTADGWRVELNATTLPRVLVNHNYYVELCRQATDKPAKDYLSERLQSANWLVKALDQRARTLLRVAEAVVARQLPFLEHGVHHLRPLLLRDIAEVTELHESTVSRATADKYLATPRGNFPFRYFFSNALPGRGGRSRPRGRGDPPADQGDDRARGARQRAVRRSDRRGCCAVPASRSRAAPWPNIAKRMAIPSSVQRRRAKALGLPNGAFRLIFLGGPSPVREAPQETSDGPHRDGR